jgi:palmitoyltransferase
MAERSPGVSSDDSTRSAIDVLALPHYYSQSFAEFMCGARWWFFSFPLLIVMALLGWGYWVYVYCFSIRLVWQEFDLPIFSVVFIACFNALWLMSLLCYFRTVFTNPGEVPASWSDEIATSISAVERKNNGAERFCNKCRRRKPDRAHHCSTCRRCVLRMDHHCPWVNNCVGFGNYKFFVLFLSYGVFLCMGVCGSTGYWAVLTIVDSRFDLQSIMTFALCIVSGIFGIGLAGFVVYHYKLMSRNLTTLESTEKMMRMAGFVNVYNLGSRRKNVEQMFGESICAWPIPVHTAQGDGIEYPASFEVLRA